MLNVDEMDLQLLLIRNIKTTVPNICKIEEKRGLQ
jgi:hypothetical protein